MKLKASLLIVVCDEPTDLVNRSLKSAACFEDVLILDMKGRHDIKSICESYRFAYLKIEQSPIVEKVRARFSGELKWSWISFLDPDEVLNLSFEDVQGLNEFISNNDKNNLSIINIKWVFRFLNRPLKGGYWSPTSKALLINRSNVIVSDEVHGGYLVQKGITATFFSVTSLLDHYWVLSMHSFLEKHWRYVIAEVEKKHARDDQPLKFNKIAKLFWRKTKNNIFSRKGFMDGGLGVFLACFHAIYVIAPEIIYKIRKQ